MSAAELLEGIRAIRHLEATGHPDPLLLLCHPPARTNPFQRLLYGEGWRDGIAALPLADLADATAIAEAARGRVGIVLHLHWLNGVTERAATAAEADAAVDAFLERLDAFRSHDGRVAWTVHNVLPHDARFEEAAVRARRGVVERSALVHALASSTAAAVAPYFEIPADRLAVVPHPSYAGAYAGTAGREATRFELGIWPDEVARLAFGAIRPYKGIDGLLAAWRSAGSGAPGPAGGSRARPRRLVVAGAVAPGPGADELLLELSVAPGVTALPRRIEDGLVADLHAAADVAVVPRAAALNSGVLLLALTCGLPIIAPRFAAAEELLDERVALLYEPGDQEGLADALRRAPGLATPEAAARAREIAARFDPARISRLFAAELRAHVGAAGRAG